MDARRSLVYAHEMLRGGKLPQAEAACHAILAQRPNDPDGLHLLGLARRRAGALDEAERWLRASISAAPLRAEFHANLGNLLRQRDRAADAEHAYRSALQLDPAFRPARLGLARLLGDAGHAAAAESEARRLLAGDPHDAEALATLGSALRGQQRIAEAEQAYRDALAIRPDYGAARHNLGALLALQQRSEAALVELDRAAQDGVRSRELAFNRGRTLADLSRFDEAEAAYNAALAFDMRHVETQVELAKLRYMRGDEDFARGFALAAGAGPSRRQLKGAHANLLQLAGDAAGAERLLRELLASDGLQSDVALALAIVLNEQGRFGEALDLAREAARREPDQPSTTEGLVGALLSVGDAAAALPLARRQRARAPLDQRWIAYEATALRLSGSAEYRALYDYDRYVRAFDLAPPPGWASMADLNAQLVRTLAARHGLQQRPLDQSLRFGTQTPRSLLVDPDPAIRAFLAALAEPIAEYRARLPKDAAHPFTARNHGASRFAGCWSVRLTRGGYHINHTHPEGWISSAYYVDVPAEVLDTELRSGWLKFGEPGLSVPEAPPEHFVQPRAGRLVLFPSYLWHGTTPIHGDQPRLTIAFDVVPAQAS